jgi:hypothetical protein
MPNWNKATKKLSFKSRNLNKMSFKVKRFYLNFKNHSTGDGQRSKATPQGHYSGIRMTTRQSHGGQDVKIQMTNQIQMFK